MTMSTAAKTATKALVLLFTSILLFTIFWFASNSVHQLPALHFNCILPKLLSLIEGKQNYHVKPHNSDQIVHHHVYNGFEEKDVVVLSAKNFNQFLTTKNQYMMVHFHATWSSFSRRQGPVYAAAATKLKGEVVFAKVDVTRETKLAEEYKITGYPSLCFFVNGAYVDIIHYEKSSDALVAWVKRKMDCRIYSVMTKTEGERILAAKYMVVLAFLDSFQGKDAEELSAASKLHTDVNFYQTDSARIAKMFKINPYIKRPALIVIENASGIYNHFDGQFTSREIGEFVYLNKHPLSTGTATKHDPMFFTNIQKQVGVEKEENTTSF